MVGVTIGTHTPRLWGLLAKTLEIGDSLIVIKEVTTEGSSAILAIFASLSR
jgi:hypothetical protein